MGENRCFKSLPSLEELTLEEKLGQMFVTGFPGAQMDQSFMELVKREKVGNVILFKENEIEEEQLKGLCRSVEEWIRQETGIPPFITADEEGGIVSRLPEDMGRMPSAMALASLWEESKVYEAARCTGELLGSIGINFNLAPVLDINNNLHNPVIGVRSYGRSGEEVWRYAAQAMKGYMDAGILCAGKHFPGHGDTGQDSHLELPIVDKSTADMEALELVPFRRAIEAGIPAITIAHLVLRGEDDLPATMSEKLVAGLLRQKMGFQGLIISDCMEMNAISQHYGIEQGVVKAVKAGIDLIFISHFHDKVRDSVKALREAVVSGQIPMKRIDEAVEKILHYKSRYLDKTKTKQPNISEKAKQMAERLFRETVYHRQEKKGKFRLGSNPCFISPAYTQVSLVSSASEGMSLAKALKRHFGGKELVISLRPDEAERKRAMALVENATSVVFGSLNATVYREQFKLMQELERKGLPMACVTLRNPFELEGLSERVFKLPVYEYTTRSVEIVKEFLEV